MTESHTWAYCTKIVQF